MKHKIKPIYLPTKDKSNIHITPTGLHYYTPSRKSINVLDGSTIAQHIYITVSQDIEPIKEGDWCIDTVTKSLYQLHRFTAHDLKNRSRKIIATTDPKLTIKEVKTFKDVSPATKITTFDTVLIHSPLPQVQQSFIEEFIANPDEEYEVEYEIDWINEASSGNTPSDIWLKLNQNNTVNITSVKEKMYSRAEVIVLLNKYGNDVANEFHDCDCSDTEPLSFEEENWIKENL